MSAQDNIFEYLWSARDHAFQVADAIDRKADALASRIRDSLSGSTWIPEAARPTPRPVPIPAPSGGPSSLDRFGSFLWNHRWGFFLATSALAGAGTYSVYRRRQRQKKRRAKRAANGARKEVVVLAGSPHDPITKSVALDLERRGFVVFVVVNSMDDEQVVLNEGRSDIRPLNIDLLDTEGAAAAVDRFQNHLRHPVQAFAGAVPHHLRLVGMVLVPDSHYATGPIETLSVETWSDTLNLRILAPFMTAKLFIPLLREFRSRLLVLTPAVVSALTPPFHAPEAAAVAALDAFTCSLRHELRPLSVDVCQLKLGTFDLSPITGRSQMAALNGPRADVITWPSTIRGAYGRLYTAQCGAGRSVKGASLRELHLEVFDALTETRPRKFVMVGSGSLIYDIVGRVAPDGLVAWMLSERRREEGTSAAGSPEGSSGSEGSVEWEKVDRMA